MPGPSISANIVEKSSSLTTTLMPSGGVSSRFFNSFASCFMTFGGRFSLVAYSNSTTELICQKVTEHNTFKRMGG